MFSGIVEEVGKVSARRFSGRTMRLEIRSLRVAREIKPGESVSVNGVCLTVEKNRGSALFEVSLSPQTQKETTLGKINIGEAVNLERALKVGDRIGGHFLTGHIDFFSSVRVVERKGDSALLKIEVPTEFERYIVRRGSIGIDGISLTVSEVKKNRDSAHFSCWLVPYTLANTNLKHRKAGQPVNVEVDMLAKYVEELIGERKCRKY